MKTKKKGKFIRFIYRLIYRRELSDRMNVDYGPCFLIWKYIRKYISVSIAPFVPFNCIRVWLYRLVGYKIGKKCFIGMQCYFDDRYPELIEIGNNVDVSYSVKFATHGPGQSPMPIILKDYSYVGMNAMLISGREGITIGEGAIIGAGSLVKKSIPDWKAAAGNPVRIIRDLPRDDPANRHDPQLWQNNTDDSSKGHG